MLFSSSVHPPSDISETQLLNLFSSSSLGASAARLHHVQSCDWLIGYLCKRAVDQVYLIKRPVTCS